METLKIIRAPDELEELRLYLLDKDIVAVDTETTGVYKESEIIGYSVCAEPELAYYIILSEWCTKSQSLIHLDTKAASYEIFDALKSKRLVFHNAVFDCSMIYNNFNVELIDSVFCDTMILAHIVDENRPNGLKDLGLSLYGSDATKEQKEMKDSVSRNGGLLTKNKYELYKADSELIAKYGAKDTILTFNVFYHEIERLYAQGLDKFFFEESMPLLKGVTYQLNTSGLRIDPERLMQLKQTLETECLQARAFIYNEIQLHTADDYPGTSKAKTFNIGSSKQLSWLLFSKLGNEFGTLTEEGRNVCKALGMKLPYTYAARKEFIAVCTARKDSIYQEAKYNWKTKKMGRPKKVGNFWNYLACGKETLTKLSDKYKWVAEFLKYAKNTKLLSTYVEGIQSRKDSYNIVRPNFLQNVVPSGRYANRNPNFQNLPRDDKRVKSCIVPRKGKVFVGVDQSQLEARVFASLSGDWRLLESFKRGEDFYSVIGMTAFNKTDCTPFKEGSPEAFGVKYKTLRQTAKVIALSAAYGTTAPKMVLSIQKDARINKTVQEAQEIIDDYFESFPAVRQFMLDSHKEAMTTGKVVSLFGRERRIPKAMDIPNIFGDIPHEKLDYEYRNLLNLAVNFKVQCTAGSIMNRSGISFLSMLKEHNITAKIILQVHDSLVVECDEGDAEKVSVLLKYAMENTVELPGVKLEAEPKVGHDLSQV